MPNNRYRTYFEHLEELMDKVEDDTGVIALPLPLVREAMTQDQHQLYHDAAWSEGCPICDEERKSENED